MLKSILLNVKFSYLLLWPQDQSFLTSSNASLQCSACLPSLAEAGDSLFSPDHLFEVEFTLCRHNRQLILQVVSNKVANAVKQHVFGSDLCGIQNKSSVMNVQSRCCWFHVGPVLLFAILTTPSGSTSRRCLGRPQCIPVSTYWPGLVVLSRTRKSPSRMRSLSASRLLMRLWYHVSLRSCSSFGATGALRRGGLGHWSSRTWVPPAAAVVVDPAAPAHASWSFRASSKGP